MSVTLVNKLRKTSRVINTIEENFNLLTKVQSFIPP